MKSKIDIRENEVESGRKRYPNLSTVLMVEDFLKKNRDIPIKIASLKKRLPKQVMHQTLMVILGYLWKSGKIIFGPKGVEYICADTKPQENEIKDAIEIETNKKSSYNVREIVKIVAIVLSVIKKFDVVRAGIFGSYARGEQRKDSDIDILVEFKGKKSLFDLVELKSALEEELKKNIDLLTYNSINRLLKDRILSEEVRIYDER